jgi:hypothetical protein
MTPSIEVRNPDADLLLPEDRDRIGHPVTIGASRVRLTAPEEPR